MASVELPVVSSLDWVAVAITAVASVLLFVRGWSVLRVLAVCAALGLAQAAVVSLV